MTRVQFNLVYVDVSQYSSRLQEHLSTSNLFFAWRHMSAHAQVGTLVLEWGGLQLGYASPHYTVYIARASSMEGSLASFFPKFHMEI